MLEALAERGRSRSDSSRAEQKADLRSMIDSEGFALVIWCPCAAPVHVCMHVFIAAMDKHELEEQLKRK